MKRHFFSWTTTKKKASRFELRAPHYNGARPRERSDRRRFFPISKKASSYRDAYRVPLFSVRYKLGDVQKARSVGSFASQLDLTNDPDRSSLVQLYLGSSVMWMNLRVLPLLLQSRTKE